MFYFRYEMDFWSGRFEIASYVQVSPAGVRNRPKHLANPVGRNEKNWVKNYGEMKISKSRFKRPESQMHLMSKTRSKFAIRLVIYKFPKGMSIEQRTRSLRFSSKEQFP